MPRCRGASGSDSTAVSPTLLRSNFPLTIETQPELLAHHLAQAGFTERAIDYLRRAGQRSIERSANAEAIGHLTRALELLQSRPDNPQRKRAAFPLEAMLSQAMIASLWVRSAKHTGDSSSGESAHRRFDRSLTEIFCAVWDMGLPLRRRGTGQAAGRSCRVPSRGRTYQ